MPTSIYDNTDLASARTAAQDATRTAASESANAISLPDQLRSALNAKFSTDNPIYASREGAIKDYFNATTQAPLNVTARSAGGNSDVIYNPAQQANLIQQYRSPSIAHLATLNDLLNLSTGGIENIIGATSRADQARVAGLTAGATAANTRYSNLFDELKARQAETEAAAKLSASGDSTDFTSLLSLLLGNKTGAGAKEPMPQGLPVKPYEPIDPKKQYFSPRQQWYFDQQDAQWIPVTD